MRKSILIIYIFIFLLVIGCTNQDQNNVSIKQKDKAPESLQKLGSSLDKILDTIGEIEKIDLGIDSTEEEQKTEKQETEDKGSSDSGKEDSEDQSGKENGQEQGQNQSEGSLEGDKQKEGEAQQEKKQPSKSEKLTETWKQVDGEIEKVHSLWNSYEVEGMKKGGSSERAEQFASSINQMTKSIENRNIIDIYDYGSQSILNLKPFWDLYTDDYGGDIAEIKHGVYQYYLRAVSDDKNAASKAIDNKEENINRIRLKIEEDEKKSNQLDKVSYGLKDLSNSLKENSKRLYMIKKDTLIQNLKTLEDS